MNDITLPIATAAVIVIALLSAFAFLVRVIAKSFENSVRDKFAEAEKARANDQQMLRADLSKLKDQVHLIERELPREYVRRDDHVEAMAVVNAKMDAVQAQGAHLLTLVARMEGKLNND